MASDARRHGFGRLCCGLLYGVRYTDMCAFRAIRRDTLLALGMREMTYGWNLEMQMRAARARPAHPRNPGALRPPHRGRSKVAGSLKGTMRATASILSTLVAVLREPINARTDP